MGMNNTLAPQIGPVMHSLWRWRRLLMTVVIITIVLLLAALAPDRPPWHDELTLSQRIKRVIERSGVECVMRSFRQARRYDDDTSRIYIVECIDKVLMVVAYNDGRAWDVSVISGRP